MFMRRGGERDAQFTPYIREAVKADKANKKNQEGKSHEKVWFVSWFLGRMLAFGGYVGISTAAYAFFFDEGMWRAIKVSPDVGPVASGFKDVSTLKPAFAKMGGAYALIHGQVSSSPDVLRKILEQTGGKDGADRTSHSGAFTFSSFSETPISPDSLIHLAKDQDGRDVAVKLLNPKQRDLALVDLSAWKRLCSVFHPPLVETMRLETDLQQQSEAKNLIRLSKHTPTVRVIKFDDTVIVMEAFGKKEMIASTKEFFDVQRRLFSHGLILPELRPKDIVGGRIMSAPQILELGNDMPAIAKLIVATHENNAQLATEAFVDLGQSVVAVKQVEAEGKISNLLNLKENESVMNHPKLCLHLAQLFFGDPKQANNVDEELKEYKIRQVESSNGTLGMLQKLSFRMKDHLNDKGLASTFYEEAKQIIAKRPR